MNQFYTGRLIPSSKFCSVSHQKSDTTSDFLKTLKEALKYDSGVREILECFFLRKFFFFFPAEKWKKQGKER